MRQRSTSPKTVEARLKAQNSNFQDYYNGRLEAYSNDLEETKIDIMNTFSLSVFTFNQLYDKHILNAPQPNDDVPQQYQDKPQNDNSDNGNGAKKSSDNTLEQAAALLELLKSQQTVAIDENKVKELIQKELNNIPPKVFQVKDHKGVIKDLDFTPPKEFEQILFLASQRENILLVGASGGGKTFTCSKLAQALGLPFGFISVTAGMSESHLNGKFLPIGVGGQFLYVPPLFIEMYENGGLFLLDEVDGADSNTLLILNAAIANGSMAVPNRHEKPIAKKHKDFILIAAGNTYGSGANRMYVGRQQLDASTLDRFSPVIMGYSENIEKTLASQEILDEFYPVRKAVEKLGLRRLVSTRFIERIEKLKSFYNTPKKRFEFLTVLWSKDDIAAVKAEMIKY